MIFLILNLLLISSAFCICVYFSKRKNLVFFILSIFLIYISEILLIEIILGALNLLSFFSVYILGVIFSVSVIIATHKKVTKRVSDLKFKEFSLSPALLFFVPIVILLIFRAFNAFLQVPLEYDSLAYHLPFVAEWLQKGSLTEIYYTAFASPIGYYPANYELLDLWFVLPFKNDIFVNLLNFPLFIFFALAIYGILRGFSIEKNTALITTSILFYMPVFLRQAGLPLVDLFFSLSFALAIYYLLVLYSKKENIVFHSTLFGLSLGIFMGTKFLGLVYCALPILFLGLIAIRKKQFIKTLLPAGLACISTGSFFYLRNFFNAKNPIFPVEIEIFGKKILEGYLGMNEKISATSLLENIKNYATFKEFSDNFFLMTGWQTRLIALGLVLSLAYALFCFFKNRKAHKTEILISSILAISTLIYFYLYFRSPYSYRDLTPNIRYAMMALILGTINLGYIISKIKAFKKYYLWLLLFCFLHALIFLIIFTPETILHNDKMILDLRIIEKYKYEFFLFCISLLCASGIFAIIFLRKRKNILILASLSLLLFFSSVNFFDSAIKIREVEAQYFYKTWYEKDKNLINLMDAFYWLNKNTNAKKVAYTGMNFHYPLYRNDFSREVFHININDCKLCRYIDFKDSPKSIRRDPDFQNWLKNLRSRQIEYIVIARDLIPEVEIYEYSWALSAPAIFSEVYKNEIAHIFKVKND